jgi:hypothetical protein
MHQPVDCGVWRLTLIQVLPAVLIWLAMFDLKVHVLRGRSFNPVRGLVLIPINLGIVALTVGAYLPERDLRVRNRGARSAGRGERVRAGAGPNPNAASSPPR